jgi:hypothetical protein
MQTTITIENKWFETAKLFGDVEIIIKQALQLYFKQQCQQRIDEATDKIMMYHQKYGCNYHTFKQSIQMDEDFLTTVELQNPLWEEDAMEWEYWLEEKQAWHHHLQAILRN